MPLISRRLWCLSRVRSWFWWKRPVCTLEVSCLVHEGTCPGIFAELNSNVDGQYRLSTGGSLVDAGDDLPS